MVWGNFEAGGKWNLPKPFSVKQQIERPLTRSQLLLTSNSKRNPVMEVEKSLRNWKRDLTPEPKPLAKQKLKTTKHDSEDESDESSEPSQQMQTSDEEAMLELRSNQTDRASRDDSILDVDEVVSPKRKKGQSKTDAKTKEKAKPKHNLRAAFERAKANRQPQPSKNRRGDSTNLKHPDSETDFDLKKAPSPLTTLGPTYAIRSRVGSEAPQLRQPLPARPGVENSVKGTGSQPGNDATSVKAASDIAKSQTQSKAATIIRQMVEEKHKWGSKSARGRGQEFGSPIPNRIPTATNFFLRDQTAIKPAPPARSDRSPRKYKIL